MLFGRIIVCRYRKEYYNHKDFFGIAFLSFLLFCSRTGKKMSSIILTAKGIEFRDNGFYRWSVIESFKTTRSAFYRNHKQYLIFYLKESTDIQIDITDLELNSEDIVEQIFKFEGAADIIYKGSE